MNLEEMLVRLRDRQPSGPLAAMEGRVWAAITARRRDLPAATIWGWRSAAAAMLLALGIVAQGARAAHAAPELELFTSRSALAPSTLLGEDR